MRRGDDLPGQLRAASRMWRGGPPQLLNEAADELERLTALLIERAATHDRLERQVRLDRRLARERRNRGFRT